MSKNYWGYRIYVEESKYFNDELKEGRLRQGWGYDGNCKLPDIVDECGARGNLPIYNKVKKGDILLIPRIPNWDDITIAEAAEDFDVGYKFEIGEGMHDFGHIFPAKIIKHISRNSKNLYADLRKKLKNIRRFWQIADCDDIIEKIINSDDNEAVDDAYRFRESLTNAFDMSFDNGKFKDLIIENIKKNFANEEWEYALVAALKIIYPHFEIEWVSGRKEKEHGTDILIRISGPRDDIEYGIAIQVKDWWGKVGEWAIDQLNKADKYWVKQNIKLIDKILIITRANYKDNVDFKRQCDENNITPMFAEDLSELLYEAGGMALLKKY